MRIRGYDEETEEYIGDIEELTGKIADLTKTAKTPGGLTLFTDETKTTYKSTYQILKDISEIYNDLTDKDQAALLETLAGKRGGQVLAGILEDFSEVERAMGNMQDAAGSADAEMEIVEESLTYKLNNFQQTWIGIVQKLVDSGDLGKLIDALTKISEVLGVIVTSIGPIPSIIAGFGLTKLITNLDDVSSLINSLPSVLNLFDINSKAVIRFTDAFKETGVASQAWRQTMTNANKATREFVHDSVLAGKSADEIASGFKTGTKSAGSFGTAIKGIGKSLAAIGTTAAIVAAIVVVTKAISACVNAEKEMAEQTKKLSDSYAQTSSDIDRYKTEIEKLQETLKDSNSSYEETKSARERLMQIQDELIKKYGSEKDAIWDITTALDGEIDALDRVAAAKWQETLNSINTPASDGLFGQLGYWFNTEAQGYADQVDKAIHQITDVRSTALGTSLVTENQKDVELLKEIAAAYDDINVSMFSGAYGGTDIVLYGDDMQQFYESLLKVQEQVKKYGGSDELNQFLEKTAQNAKKVNDQYGSFGDQYVLNEKILKSFDYSKSLDDVTAAVEKYKKAYSEGFANDAEKNQAISELASVYDSAIANIDDAQVIAYIEKLYPAIQSTIADWKFDLNFNTDGTKENLEDIINRFKEANGGDISYEDLRDFNENAYDASDERIAAYKDLELAAEGYDLSVTNLIEKLKEEKLVMSEGYQKLVDKYGEANIAALSPEDLAIAETYADTMFGSYDALLSKIAAAKEEQKQLNDEQAKMVSWASERDAALMKLGMASESNGEVTYDESWTKYLETIKQLNPELASNQEEVEKCALANLQFSHAVDDLSKNFDSYKSALQDANALTPEYSNAINALADDLSYLTGVDFSIENASKFLSDAENFKLLEQAIQGSDEALQRLQARAAETIKIKVDPAAVEELRSVVEAALEELPDDYEIALNLNSDVFYQDIQEFATWLNANSNVGGIDVYALLDSSPFMRNLGELMSESATVATAVKKMFSDLGWDVKWDEVKVATPNGSHITSTYAKDANGNPIGQSYVKWDYVTVPTNIRYIPKSSGGGQLPTSKYTPTSFSPSQKSSLSSPSGSSGGGGGGSDKTDEQEDPKEQFDEFYDYFDRFIKVLDQRIDLLRAHLEDVVGSVAKNMLLDAQEAQIKKKMAGYSSAIEMYSEKASEALSKIPSEVAEKLQNGAVAIDEFIGEENEEVVQAMNDYDGWADKIAECKQQLVELKEALRQLELEKFNNIVQDFDTLFDVRQTQIDLIEKSVQLFEASSDKVVSRAFYDRSIEQKSKQLDKLMEEKTKLTNQMTKAMANGIDVASDEWFSNRPLMQKCI